MELQVKLDVLLEALDNLDDMEEYGWYINLETGEVHVLWDEQVDGEYNDELYERIAENPESYLKLPDWNCVDHFKIMESFVADKVSDAKKQKKLAKTVKTVKRTRVFGKFDGEVNALGLLEAWQKYQDEEYEKFAREWCVQKNITII